MDNDGKEHRCKRRQHLRVPVFPEEKREIEANAKRVGVSVARYLRDVGQGYQIKGVMDYQHVRELVQTAEFGEATILALPGRIEATQDDWPGPPPWLGLGPGRWR